MSANEAIHHLSEQIGNLSSQFAQSLAFNATLQLLDIIVWVILLINTLTFVQSLPYLNTFLSKIPVFGWILPTLNMALTIVTLLYALAVGSSYMAMAGAVSAASVAVSIAICLYKISTVAFNLIRFRSFTVAYYGLYCYSINGTYFSSSKAPVSISLESGHGSTFHNGTCLKADPAAADIVCFTATGRLLYSPVSKTGVPSKIGGFTTTIHTYTPVSKLSKIV